MKKIFFAFILGLFCLSGFAQEVTIDKENCTITKDGKTFPLYGEVLVVESGSADLTVKVVDGGVCDLEVKDTNGFSASSCGEWKFVSFGSHDFSVRFVDSGSADLEIKFVSGGECGIYY